MTETSTAKSPLSYPMRLRQPRISVRITRAVDNSTTIVITQLSNPLTSSDNPRYLRWRGIYVRPHAVHWIPYAAMYNLIVWLSINEYCRRCSANNRARIKIITDVTNYAAFQLNSIKRSQQVCLLLSINFTCHIICTGPSLLPRHYQCRVER